MSRSAFFLQLSVLTLLAALALTLIQRYPDFAAHKLFSWCCLGLYVLLSVLMFYAAHAAARSENKNDFTTVAMGFSGGKIFLSAILILIYAELTAPSSKLFVLPFFGIYLLYTIFEVYFMMRLGRMKP